MAGVVTLAIGRMAFALMPSALLRALIALSFAVPAAMAGYEAAFGLIQLSVASHPWCSAFGAVGALLTGGTAFTRVTPPARPRPRQAHPSTATVRRKSSPSPPDPATSHEPV